MKKSTRTRSSRKSSTRKKAASASRKTSKKKAAKKKATKKKPVKKKPVRRKSTKRTATKKKAAKKKTLEPKAAKRAPKKAAKKAARKAKKTVAKTAAKKAKASSGPKSALRLKGAAPAEATLSPTERKRIEQEKIDTIWRTYKRTGDENLRNILVEYHFPLVRYIAERLLQTLPKSIELDDLVSAGTFGLLDAIRGFDLKRGIKFKTYCSTRIRGSILDELRSQDWVPRLVRLKAHKLERAIQKLAALNGREANDYELAREMGLTMNELSDLKAEANPRTIFSLSEKLDDTDDDRDMEKVEIIEDKKGCDPAQTLHQQDILEMITSNLTKKERLIIIMYYYEGLTMREIGDIMNLTESRVCQIHSNVMGRLKTQIKELALEGATV